MGNFCDHTTVLTVQAKSLQRSQTLSTFEEKIENIEMDSANYPVQTYEEVTGQKEISSSQAGGNAAGLVNVENKY